MMAARYFVALAGFGALAMSVDVAFFFLFTL